MRRGPPLGLPHRPRGDHSESLANYPNFSEQLAHLRFGFVWNCEFREWVVAHQSEWYEEVEVSGSLVLPVIVGNADCVLEPARPAVEPDSDRDLGRLQELRSAIGSMWHNGKGIPFLAKLLPQPLPIDRSISALFVNRVNPVHLSDEYLSSRGDYNRTKFGKWKMGSKRLYDGCGEDDVAQEGGLEDQDFVAFGPQPGSDYLEIGEPRGQAVPGSDPRCAEGYSRATMSTIRFDQISIAVRMVSATSL